MHKIWLIFDPRTALIGLFAFLFLLALAIHYILLSSDGFDWLQGPNYAPVEMTAGMTALPSGK
ncbi:light-harvesting antenna LH1, alpha subunit [Thiocystis violacea]|uniref:light-harvesting antenna LH1, alpha subunit n=1 Tax=Thiocystis violacea TaxID=13725 RepID=UPI0019075AA4|nr:light-harvesting antenna LH1, alpha subunit [Thiocystis violacea]MBK1721165.1 light-harvesting protein [Thiocystis violacea]